MPDTPPQLAHLEDLGDATKFAAQIHALIPKCTLLENFSAEEVRLFAHFMHVYRAEPGVEIIRNVGLSNDREGEGTHAYVRYNQVRVPQENLLGGEGQVGTVCGSPNRSDDRPRRFARQAAVERRTVTEALRRAAFGAAMLSAGRARWVPDRTLLGRRTT